MKTVMVLLCSLWLVTGCITREAVDTSKAVDDRPGLTFTVPDSVKAQELVIYVDGLMMGTADKFKTKEGVLRVLKGTHVVKVMKGDKIVSEQKIYVGDSQTKVIPINIQ